MARIGILLFFVGIYFQANSQIAENAFTSSDYSMLFGETANLSLSKKKANTIVIDKFVINSVSNISGLNHHDLIIGKEKMMEADFDSAIYYFNRILTRIQYSSNDDYLKDLIYINMISCYFNKDDLKNTRFYLKKCSDGEIGELSNRVIKANFYFLIGDISRSEKYLKLAIKKDRNKDAAYIGLISLYQSLDDPKEKIRQLEAEHETWRSEIEKQKGEKGLDEFDY